MKLIFGSSQSTVMPKLLDTESSQTTVFIRRNVEERTRQEDGREPETYYVYEECQLSKSEYQQYCNEQLAAENADLRAQLEENSVAMMELAAMISDIATRTEDSELALMELAGTIESNNG